MNEPGELYVLTNIKENDRRESNLGKSKMLIRNLIRR